MKTEWQDTKIFAETKHCYHAGAFNPERDPLKFDDGPSDMIEDCIKVLKKFAPFAITFAGRLILENELGIGYITRVHHASIRVDYFSGKARGSYEWIEADTFK